MAKKQELDIIIKATNEASPELRRLGNQLDDVEDSARGAQNGFKRLESGLSSAQAGLAAVAGAAAVIGQTVVFAKEGVAMNRVADTFNALGESIGATAGFMERLQVATGGAVSNLELMQGANKILGLGLAGTEDEAVKLIETAVKLGTAFGSTASESIESFGLLLANQSVERLDSFGIASGEVRARVEELTTGTNALTREQAFLQATLEGSNDAMQRLGIEGDAATDSITRLEIKAQNASDAFKRWVADGIIPVVDGLTSYAAATDVSIEAQDEAIRSSGTYVEFLEKTGQAHVAGGRQMFEYSKALLSAEDAAKRAANEQAEFQERIELSTKQRERQTKLEIESARQLADETTDLLQLQDESEAQFRRNQTQRRNEAIENNKRETEESERAIEQTIAARKAAAEEGRRLFQQEIEQINAIVNARQIQLGTDAAASLQRTQTIQQATAADATFTDELLAQASALGITSTQFVLGAEATGLYSEAQIRAALAEAALKEETTRLATAVANGEIKIQDAITALQTMEERFRTTEQSARDLASELDRIPSTISVNVEFTSTGEVVLPGGADGGVEGSRAHGGPVSAGSPYLVGEQGREIFIPNQSGTIVNNTQTEQMLGGNNITINVNSPMMATPQAIANSVSNELGRRMRG